MIQSDIIVKTTTQTVAAPQSPVSWNVWDLCYDGYFFMLAILVLALVALGVFAFRAIVISNGARMNALFMQRIRDYVHESEIESADNLCRKTNTPSSRIVWRGLNLLGRPIADISEILNLTADIELTKLGRGNMWLPFTAVASLLFGLFGAVAGTVNKAYCGDTSVESLMTPWVTLLVGLVVAFLAFIAYCIVKSKLKKARLTLKSVVLLFINIISEPAA